MVTNFRVIFVDVSDEAREGNITEWLKKIGFHYIQQTMILINSTVARLICSLGSDLKGTL